MAVAVGVLSVHRDVRSRRSAHVCALDRADDDGGGLRSCSPTVRKFHVADLAAVMFGATPFRSIRRRPVNRVRDLCVLEKLCSTCR